MIFSRKAVCAANSAALGAWGRFGRGVRGAAGADGVSVRALLALDVLFGVPHRVHVEDRGLAGQRAAIGARRRGLDVTILSLVPVKRSHSVCAQGGINSVNASTRQQGDNEWKHFDDTVYGGDFLQHQPPVKEMADWAPRIIDLMDRLGVPFNRSGSASALHDVTASSASVTPLFDAYTSAVSTATLEEFCRTVLSWLDQHCSLVTLRPG